MLTGGTGILRTTLILCSLTLSIVATARAQGTEALGMRALGMGGAFVAVADDASATYWNPAGLATGAIFSAVFDYNAFETGDQDEPFGDLQGGSGGILAVGTPPLGFTYYRLRSTRLHAAGGAAPTDGPLGSASELVTHHTGVTLVQSVGEHLHLGTTLKYIRGETIVLDRLPDMAGDDALGRVREFPGRGGNAFDLDIGAMAVFGQLRAGLVIRNTTEPEFETRPVGTRETSLMLQRQVRAGVAWLGILDTTLSADVDLTRTDTELGERRHVAFGAERWFVRKRVGVRGGFRVNTIDDVDPVGSAGVSISVTPTVYIDTFITRGASRADRAWGVGGRLAF